MRRTESRLLQLSVWGALAFAVLGLVLGLITASQMIFFDGAYSLISLALSLMVFLAFRYVGKEDQRRFPYGKETIEPLVVVIKAIVISVMCFVAIVSSITEFFTGGSEVVLGPALAYAALSTVVCFVIFSTMKRKKDSELLKAESAQWMMDTLLSVVVLIGFFIAWLLQGTTWAFLVPYIDPLMVLLAAGYFLTVPYGLIKTNGRELLRMTPAKDIQKRIAGEVQSLKQAYRMEDAILRTSKIGRTIYMEIDVILNENSRVTTVKEMDLVREELDKRLSDITEEKWVTMSFTMDEKSTA
ncbi:cation diffusion facilitator family transporter [Salicibibacter kimchii]|uniref:Cation diffusion facilitator family transporter n=1 Tax=Salicibibacter kimchii TaxID=2099786 RepID=A0A345BXD9_9BACI|nr:cation diffusion facilitator family transporter [Salicibibacter kimchii]AXF55620.1 cation diffusion facilitator family transporter [Salicibibacter kimchii]